MRLIRLCLALTLALAAPAALAVPVVSAALYAAIGSGLITMGVAAVTALSYAIVIGATLLYANYQRRSAERKARNAYNASLRDRVQNVRSAVEPRKLVLGRARVGGHIQFIASTGSDKEKLVLLIELSAEEIDGVEAIYFNDAAVTLDGEGRVTSEPWVKQDRRSANELITVGAGGVGVFTAPGPVLTVTTPLLVSEEGTYTANFSGSQISLAGPPGGSALVLYQYTHLTPKAKVWWYLGTPSQAADARLIELFPEQWTAAHRLRGIAYLVAELDYDQDVFQQGVPNISALIRGSRVFDPRTNTTAWSQNPALLIRHYALHPLGGNLPAGSVSDAHCIAAANACDQVVSYTVDGVVENRPLYTAGTVAKSGSRPLDVIGELAEAMAGKVAYANNRLVMRAGVWTPAVLSLGEGDVSDAGEIDVMPQIAREQLVNIVTGLFTNPAANWQAVDFPRVAGQAYINADGRELPVDVEFGAINHVGQAQQVAAVMIRDARQALTITASFKLRAYPVELFDVVSLTLPRFGWVAKQFEVLNRRWTLEGGVRLTLKEIDPSIYELGSRFSAADPAPNTALPRPWEIPVVGPIAAASGTQWLARQADGTVLSRVRVSWPPIQDASVLTAGEIEVAYCQAENLLPDEQWPRVLVAGSATEAFIVAEDDRLRYVIKARARGTLAMGPWSQMIEHVVVGKTEPPPDVEGLVYSFEQFGVRLQWTALPDLDVQEYELRVGAESWDEAIPIASVRATAYLWRVLLSGPTVVQIKAVDTSGNRSFNPTSVTVDVQAPSQVGLQAYIEGADEVLAWTPPAFSAFAIDRYEIRRGDVWSDAILDDTTKATSVRRRINYGGSRNYLVAAVDAAGNVGAPALVTISVAAPGGIVAPRAEVIDNNVLLYWQPPAIGSLPVERYEVRKGASWEAGSSVGSNGASTFTTVFEQQGGLVNYWVNAIDTAGNEGIPIAIAATVNQPPDYVLRSNIDSAFGGTRTNLLIDAGVMVGPVNTTETWGQHFETNNWSTIQAQINAGYPLYAMPSLATAQYEEIIDYGTALPPTVITTTLNREVVAGVVSVTAQISYKLNAVDPWIDGAAGAESVLAPAFRYVRVRYSFTATGGDDLIRITGLNIKLSVKLKTDSGTGTASAADASGTLVTFGVAFVDVDGIVVTPLASAARFAVVNFTDTPYPTGFRVLLFDVNGNRVSGGFGWSARGY